MAPFIFCGSRPSGCTKTRRRCAVGHCHFEKGPIPAALRLAWRHYAAFTVFGAAVVIAIGLARNPNALSEIDWQTFALRLAGYCVFGMVQALIFFSFVQTRLRQAVPAMLGEAAESRSRSITIVATAAIFSLAHFPNGPLMAATLVCGLGWATLFHARPNIVLLGFSHAVLGTLFHQFVGVSMRIGPFYHDPDSYVFRSVVPGLAGMIDGRW